MVSRFARLPVPASLLATLLLAGCAVGPDYATPQFQLPGHWSNAPKSSQSATAPELARWWEKLGDKTLNRLVDEAVAGNLDVAKAKANIRAARATLVKTGGTLEPTLSTSDSAQRLRSKGNVDNMFQAGFDASWELDLFGGNRRGVEAATHSAEAAEDDLYSTLLTLIGDVATNYIEARGYQARIALASRTAASQRQTAALTKAKLDAGTASAVDVAKADAIAASTEANIPAYRLAYSQAVHRLGILLGREPEALIAEMNRGGAIPLPRRGLPIGIPADVLANRPDVRAAERRLAQSTALIGQAEAQRYPSISLTGSISSSATRIGDMGKSTAIGWAFGPTLTVPIFNGGQLAAAVDVAAANRDVSFIAFKASVLGALEDVENALVAVTQQRLQMAKLDEAASRYRQAAELSRTLYQTGASSFLDVLDAERSLYSAEDALIVSRTNIATDYVALAKALGAGWDKPVDVTKPEVVDQNTGPHLALNKAQ
ncbi:efflux transporter outer membrane subunit [Oryzibacter oryziterrae]|uniref:efflux transporter outer membrane subunit n=1 Tax=Oryzibacter oryziterrae TaxID=2766474 RepID=UPI001EFFC591|nr:efflux transporter outer membrane subunit [Oryzibacter oryziterrae]